mmetsp:Transcript_12654/g.11210  ORF Transcript_12654/g.11210 Transcript_12654/m.11210 type:complete len:110 (+) Transcript_12654:1292-1621(+)
MSSNGSKYIPPGDKTGDFHIKTKHKSDSKKQYNQSPLINNNFDTYGMYDGGMNSMNPYVHPGSLNQIRGAGNSFHPRMSNFAARRLFPDPSKKVSGQDPYRGNSQPDFN